MYIEKLETFESILKKYIRDLEYLECAEGTIVTLLGMCPLIYQPTSAVSLTVLLSTQSWKYLWNLRHSGPSTGHCLQRQ